MVRIAPPIRGIVLLALASMTCAASAPAQSVRPIVPDRGVGKPMLDVPAITPRLRIEPAPRIQGDSIKPVRPASPRIAVPPVNRPAGSRPGIAEPRPVRPDPRGTATRLPGRDGPPRITPKTRRPPPERPPVVRPRPRPVPPPAASPRAVLTPVCIGGSAAGNSCICADGSIVPALGQRLVRCPMRIEPSAPACPSGQVRIAGACIDRDRRGSGAAGVCLYGTWRRGACTCPGGRTPQRLGRNHYACRPDFTCEPGWRRVGSRCLRVDQPSSLPPIENPEVLDDGMPECAEGFKRRGDRCVRTTSDAACPRGHLELYGRCLRRAPAGVGNAAIEPGRATSKEFEPDEVLVAIFGPSSTETAAAIAARYRLTRSHRTGSPCSAPACTASASATAARSRPPLEEPTIS